ncbi:MAG: PilZ domain-containing protein [Treponema sp.]|nr:PilZ domain-containing protein [Treponema sp.]
MVEKRISIRYASSAKVQINSYTESIVLMIDISPYGCCISYPGKNLMSGFTLEVDHEYILRVFPEPDTRMGEFEMVIKPCWIRNKNDMQVAGCCITQFPAGKEKFSAYLAGQTKAI